MKYKMYEKKIVCRYYLVEADSEEQAVEKFAEFTEDNSLPDGWFEDYDYEMEPWVLNNNGDAFHNWEDGSEYVEIK